MPTGLQLAKQLPTERQLGAETLLPSLTFHHATSKRQCIRKHSHVTWQPAVVLEHAEVSLLGLTSTNLAMITVWR